MSIEDQKTKLRAVFSEALDLPQEQVTDELSYNTTAQWDSVAHMALIAAIEEAFDILIDTNDVIDMSSFAKAAEIVAKYQDPA
jgi:acyl carrier protein